MRKITLALALAAVPLLAGCRGRDPDQPAGPPSPIAQEGGIQVDSVPAK